MNLVCGVHWRSGWGRGNDSSEGRAVMEQGLRTPGLWLASGVLSPEAVLLWGYVCAGFSRDGHGGPRSLGRALHALAEGPGFYSMEANEFGGQKARYHGENSCCVWVLLLPFGFYFLKINPEVVG